MTAHTELEGRPVTLNEEGNDHVESLQAEARQADEAASGQDDLTRAAAEAMMAGNGLASALGHPTGHRAAIEAGKAALANIRAQREEQAVYRRQRALELAVDVYRTGLAVDVYRTGTAIGHADITTLAREFDLFLAGKEADHEA